MILFCKKKKKKILHFYFSKIHYMQHYYLIKGYDKKNEIIKYIDNVNIN